MMKSTLRVVVLCASLVGMVVSLQGLRIIDTIGVLVCGVVAGGALAAIAGARRNRTS